MRLADNDPLAAATQPWWLKRRNGLQATRLPLQKYESDRGIFNFVALLPF
jgi:hypothetical protein